MNERPLISLVLPTKGRPFLVDKVIRSALQQSVRNVEVVVIDNSDDELTSRLVTSIGDDRVRLVRTGGMNMPENWDIALRSAQGSYVTVVNDKTILSKGALEKMLFVLEEEDVPFVTWVIGVQDSFDISECADGLPKYHSVNNVEVIGAALACRIDLYQRLAPRGTNCLVRASYLGELFEKYGALCRPISPDYSLSVFMLENAERSSHIYEILGRVVRAAPSNTEELKMAPFREVGYIASLGICSTNFLRAVPAKVILTNNLLLSDLLETLRLVRGRSDDFSMLEYYLMNLSDLIILKNQRLPYSEQLGGVLEKFRGESLKFKASFGLHALKRFASGWPRRNARMRDNLGDFILGSRMMFLSRSVL